MSYWIAAFSQSADYLQYLHFDKCGNVMGDGKNTPPLRGLMRTSPLTGASWSHLGVPYDLNMN